MTQPAITDLQAAIVRLISEDITRYPDLAEELDVNENRIRREVRWLCSHFDCPMRDLPLKLSYLGRDEYGGTFDGEAP